MNESWAKLAAKVGVPSAIAVFLVYRLTIGIETSQAGMRDELRSHVAATAPLIHSQQQLVNLALQSCVMQAPNKAGQTACFAALVSPPQPPAR